MTPTDRRATPPRRAILDTLYEANETLKDASWHLDCVRDLLQLLPDPPASAAAPSQAAPEATAPAPSMPPADGGRGVAPPLDIARRAVACRHWRWLPAMGVMRQTLDGSYVLTERVNERGAPPIGGSGLPDLDDPATLGGLLALVRAAWGRPDVHAQPLFPGGWVTRPDLFTPSVSDTEAEALVAALEAAP